MRPGNHRNDAISIFQKLLREQPLTWLTGGGVLACRHEDVAWALTSPDVRRPTEWSVERKPEGPFREFGRHNMVGLNPPDHTRFRQSTMRAFSAKRTEALTGLIEETCDRLIDRLRDRQSGDFIADFALGLPVAIICHMLGIPLADHELFENGSHAMLAGLEITATPEDLARAGKAAGALFDYLSDVATDRERALGEDLLSLLIENQKADKLSRKEVIWASTSLLLAHAFHRRCQPGSPALRDAGHPGHRSGQRRGAPELRRRKAPLRRPPPGPSGRDHRLSAADRSPHQQRAQRRAESAHGHHVQGLSPDPHALFMALRTRYRRPSQSSGKGL